MEKPSPGAYAEAEFETAKNKIIAALTMEPSLKPMDHPIAVLLGGQSGAGKTTLHGLMRSYFKGNQITVNGDGFRSYHPRYRQLDKEYGPESVGYTAPWAGAMTEAVVDSLSTVGYNLAVEGTLRTTEVPTKTAMLLRERGYSVYLAVMAVKPEISLISCQIRYEQMRIAGTVPRATDPAHHNLIIKQIVSNLAQLEEDSLFEGVYLVNRAKEVLYPVKGAQKSASETLQSVLFGEWTPTESAHYDQLKKQLEALKATGKARRRKPTSRR